MSTIIVQVGSPQIIEVNTSAGVTVEVHGIPIKTVEVISQRGERGLQGIKGDKGDTNVYEHTQWPASDEWVIVHNLGYNPNVTIKDTTGRRVFTDVEYININTVKSKTAAPMSGSAYLT